MRIGNELFSYPILSDFNEDYISSKFEVKYSIHTRNFQTQILKIDILLEDKIIESYLNKNIAQLIIHIECSTTSYRKAYKLNGFDRSFEILIDEDYMRDSIDVNVLIVLNQHLDTYFNPNINKKYFGPNYQVNSLEKGNVLAATKTEIIELPDDNHDFENISSVINVGLSKHHNMRVNIDSDIILIELPKKEYENYYLLSQTGYADIVMTSTIMPCLIYILDKMSNTNDPIDNGLIWFKVIEKKIESADISISDINTKISSVELAQMILENPLTRALDTMKKAVENYEL